MMFGGKEIFPDKNKPRYCSRNFVANALDISVRTVDRLIMRGKLRCLKMDRAVRIEFNSLQEYIALSIKIPLIETDKKVTGELARLSVAEARDPIKTADPETIKPA